MNDHWDTPVRGEQHSIVTKRRQLDRFFEDPTEERLTRFARSLWAYRSWAAVEFPVRERMLREHTPAEFREFLRAVEAGDTTASAPGTPSLGTWVMSEILEAMNPEEYATLNADARDGMAALGYDTPETPLQDGDEYWQYVDSVKQAVDRFDLRASVSGSVIEEVPDDVPPVDVAQVAFRLHADDQFAFDLVAVADA